VTPSLYLDRSETEFFPGTSSRLMKA
jgi:hypothetical protein